MTVTALLDVVRDEFTSVWNERCGPDDEIVYDISLDYRMVNGEPRSIVSMFIGLMMPEVGPKQATTCHMVMPIEKVIQGNLDLVAIDLWERLVSARLMHSLEADEEPTEVSETDGLDSTG